MELDLMSGAVKQDGGDVSADVLEQILERIDVAFPHTLPDDRKDLDLNGAWELVGEEVSRLRQRAEANEEQATRLQALESHVDNLEAICKILHQAIKYNLPRALDMENPQLIIKEDAKTGTKTLLLSGNGLGTDLDRLPGADDVLIKSHKTTESTAVVSKDNSTPANYPVSQMVSRPFDGSGEKGNMDMEEVMMLLLNQQRELEQAQTVNKEALELIKATHQKAEEAEIRADTSFERADHWKREAEWLQKQQTDLSRQNMRLLHILQMLGLDGVQNSEELKKRSQAIPNIKDLVAFSISELESLKSSLQREKSRSEWSAVEQTDDQPTETLEAVNEEECEAAPSTSASPSPLASPEPVDSCPSPDW